MLQVMNCGVGQEYCLLMIQVYILLGFVYCDTFVSWTVMSQTVNIYLLVFIPFLLQPQKKVINFVLDTYMFLK